MRSFDTWNRYLDNNGNPLHGCIQFMVKDGNTVAPIYDSDGTAIDNPQLTDIYGRTQHQVFIDVDVVAYFYKYIGNGIWSSQEGIDTSDQTKWTLEYTIENQNTMSRTVDSTGTYAVSTIVALRELNIDEVPEINGVKVITLLGHNTIGDKEPINYYWDPESTEADNDGSVIQYEDEITGRWIMVQPTHHCDSRHFGVFPSNSYNTAASTYGISKLFEYCNSKGISPFFDTNGDYVWYRYNYLNISSDNPIIVSDNIQFFDNVVSTIGGEWIGDPHFVQRNTNVIAKNVKTSWDAKSYTGYENVILDKYSEQKNWQDAHIDTRMLTYGYNFNHCTFEENRNLGSNNGTDYNTFFDCQLTGKMFVVTGDNATSFATGQASNCEVRQEDWIESDDHFYYYIQLRMTNVPDANFDYKNRTSAKNPIVQYDGRVITSDVIRLTNYNYIGTGARIDRCDASVLEINNCTGRYNLSNWGNGCTIVIKNCKDFYLTGTGNGINLTIESSELSVDNIGNLNNVVVRDSTINGDLNDVIRCSAMIVKDSVINAKFDVTTASYYNTIIVADQECGSANVIGCNISSFFTLYGVSGDPISFVVHNDAGQETMTLTTTRYLTGIFKDNTVGGRIVLGANADSEHIASNWLARGLSITNNTGIVAHPIWVNRGISTRYEQYNIYEYKGNKGTFPGHYSYQLQDASNYVTDGSPGCVHLGFRGRIDGWPTHHEGETGKTDPNTYMMEIEMFTIGVYNVRMKMTTYPGATWNDPQHTPPPRKDKALVFGTTRVLDTMERTVADYQADLQVFAPWPKDLTWMNNMTWRITNWYGFMTFGGNTLFSQLQYCAPMEFDAEPITAWPNIS